MFNEFIRVGFILHICAVCIRKDHSLHVILCLFHIITLLLILIFMISICPIIFVICFYRVLNAVVII